MLGRAFTAIVEATRTHLEGEGIPFEPCLVEASADLPPGGGLGCSAATGVAVARALDPSAAPSVVAARAMEWERVFHGNPSGIDAAVAARGGSVLFERGAPIVQLRVRSELSLVIGSSGMASSTKSMVDLVAKKLSTQPDVTRGIFERIRGLVRDARAAIEAGDVTLVRGDLRAVPTALRLAARTLRVIKQNLFWAFGHNVAAIPLAALGLLNPMIAGAAMAASAVLVVLNSLRLRRFH